MSRARKGLKAPVKKRRRVKVNPYRRIGLGADSGPGEIWYDPTSAEGQALAASLAEIFGPSEGRVVAVGCSDNLRL